MFADLWSSPGGGSVHRRLQPVPAPWWRWLALPLLTICVLAGCLVEGAASATPADISSVAHPAIAVTPAAAATAAPAGPTPPLGAGSGAAPVAGVTVPSPTPFVAPAIAPVTPIEGANQTPGPIATPSLVGGAAGAAPGAAPAAAGVAQPATAHTHGPSAGIVAVLLLGFVALGGLILGGARALWRQGGREDRGDPAPRTRRT